ncbi:hypothetical protein PY365_22185 [Roseiarcaceae bacterium H3SJ34-1]|nr:hypothetical protein [Roseiarcaceae bacterium H3SJ34-1]
MTFDYRELPPDLARAIDEWIAMQFDPKADMHRGDSGCGMLLFCS